MDREAIVISAQYQELKEQHFHGGYFSEAVRAQGERFKELGEAEKQAFFQETFNVVWQTAERVLAHPDFQPSTQGEHVDLSSEGLGSITVALTKCDEEEARSEGISPYKGVMVFPQAFNPTAEKREKWINAPGDDLGLYTRGPTMVTVDNEPRAFGEHVFARLDGSFIEDDGDDIDCEVMRLLDAKETLEVMQEALCMKDPAESILPMSEVTAKSIKEFIGLAATHVANASALRREAEQIDAARGSSIHGLGKSLRNRNRANDLVSDALLITRLLDAVVPLPEGESYQTEISEKAKARAEAEDQPQQ